MTKNTNASIHEGYKHISSDPEETKHIVETCLRANRTAMLWGAPGQGKTSICHQLGNEMKDDDGNKFYDSIIVFNPSQMDAIDAKLPYIDDSNKGAATVRYAVSEMIPREGRHLIVIDEINTAPPGTAPMWFSLTLEKRIGNYYLPENCGIVATGNRETDRSAAQPMALAQKDRMIHINVTPSMEAFCNYGLKNGVREEVIAYVRFNPTALDANDPDDPIGGCSPRSLEALSDLIKIGCKESLEQRMIFGTVGRSIGIDFAAFISLFRGKIDFDMLIDNPKTYQLFEERDKLFAVVTGLANRVTNENHSKIMTYVERLSPVYQTLFMTDAILRCPTLVRSAKFRKFCTENSDLIL